MATLRMRAAPGWALVLAMVAVYANSAAGIDADARRGLQRGAEGALQPNAGGLGFSGETAIQNKVRIYRPGWLGLAGRRSGALLSRSVAVASSARPERQLRRSPGGGPAPRRAVDGPPACGVCSRAPFARAGVATGARGPRAHADADDRASAAARAAG